MYLECRHIKSDGKRCRAAALKAKPYCFFHMKFERMHKTDTPEIPPIEDSTSVLLAIGQVVRALNYETMNCKRAGLMLYGLQIAASVTARREQAERAEKVADTVRSIHNLPGEPVEFSEASTTGAPMLAPENSVCEPPSDCAGCRQKRSCKKQEATLRNNLPGHSDDHEIHNPEHGPRVSGRTRYSRSCDGGAPPCLAKASAKPDCLATAVVATVGIDTAESKIMRKK